jgi:arginyl-tRNA synthetase
VTPEQLSDVIVAALNRLVEQGRIRLPDGVPARVVVERP